MKKQSRKDRQHNSARMGEQRRSDDTLATADSNHLRTDGEDRSSKTVNKWTILLGDRVWFDDRKSDENDHNTRRGIIREIHYDTSNKHQVKSYSIQPLHHFFKEKKDTWRVKAKMVYRDVSNWTTRFGVEDKVVCATNKGWNVATITHLWPVWLQRDPQNDEMQCYQMMYHPLKGGRNRKPMSTTVPEDADYCVREHPSIFRFSVNDKVSVDLFRAEHRGSSIPTNNATNGWSLATVTNVDILGLEFYAVYECKYQTSTNQTVTCWVPYDTDEYIAAIDANPRDRLMDSIRQDCSYNHFRYLFRSSGIDAPLIQDLILSKAIEFGCFAALRWLEYDMKLELASLKFDNGNTLLHQSAQSQSRHKFLKGLARASFEKGSLTSFSLTSMCREDSCTFWKRKNDSGETFLDILLKTKDLRTLECIFSPQNGLFWVINKRFEGKDWYTRMERAFHPFSPQGLLVSRALEDTAMHSRSCLLTSHFHDETEEEIFERHFMKDLDGPNAVEVSKKLIRFVDQWKGHNLQDDSPTMPTIMRNVSICGCYQIFRSLVEANPSLLKEKDTIRTSKTRNEFVQEEIYPTVQNRECDSSLEDVPTMITCGSAPHRPCFESWEVYLSYVRETFQSESLLSDLEAVLKDGDLFCESVQIASYQISLLKDPPTLPGRLKIMDYLVSNSFIKPPNPLLPIRMRQCGVFRWLVDKGHVRLGAAAVTQLNTPDARKVEFLGGQKIPAFVLSGTFLCFACVEYDSLFALQWLVNDNSVALDEEINGYNILHACAYFGRLEIILWLHRRVQWPTLSSKASSRKGFEKYSGLHIALSRGFTNAVELMISLGHPIPEGKQLLLESMALNSPHEHVRMWGKERLRHVGLSKDVGKLLKMVSKPGDHQSRKRFIHSSRCMMNERWNEANVYRDDQPLPSGMSYRDVILKCFETDDAEFVLWLCHEVSSKTRCFRPFLRSLQRGFEFWTGAVYPTLQLVGHSFNLFLDECQDEELVEYSRQSWARKSNIPSPDDHPFISKGLLSTVLRQRFRNELIILLICDKLLSALRHEISLRIVSGTSGDALSELHSIQRKLAEKSIEAEHSVHNLEDYFPNFGAFSIDGHVKLGFCVYSCDETYRYSETHPIKLHWSLEEQNFDNLPVYCFVAIENYTHLIDWLYRNGKGWSSENEITMVRIASYLGHEDLVDFFEANAMYSSPKEIEQAILLGAGEAGREMVCQRLLDDKRLCNELAESSLAEFSRARVDSAAQKDAVDETQQVVHEALLSSLPAMIVRGYLSCWLQNVIDLSSQSERYLSMLRTLTRSHGHSPFSLFEAAISVLEYSDHVEFWESATKLLEFLHDDLSLNFAERQYKSTLVKFGNRILERSLTKSGNNEEREFNVTKDLLCALEHWGLDVQSMKVGRSNKKKGREDRLSLISALQEKQRARWAQFNLIKADRPLDEVCGAIESGSLTMDSADRNGQKLVHIAAAYDRVDVLEWLVEKNNENLLEQKDREGRNAIESATASKAQASASWLQERRARKTLSMFWKLHVRRRLAAARKAKYLFAIQRLQSRQRGRQVRRVYRAQILWRVAGAQRYRAIWETPIGMLTRANPELPTWSSLRSSRESRSSQIDEIDEILESRKALDVSVIKALDDEIDHDFGTDENNNHEEYAVERLDAQMVPLSSTATTVERAAPCDTIHLSTDVVKWLKRADGKFQQLFINKIERLWRGERSRTLAKALKGSVSVIYESYLEQKSGQRVLWQQEKDGTIFVWYVAKHKHVSRLMGLIDDCERRASRQRISASSQQDVNGPTTASQEVSGDVHLIRLNPLGNVPLKVYEVHSNKLHEMLNDDWVPKLHLSREERDIVETHGTVLLLGRSGTGKTVCICNRIHLDFWRFRDNPHFKQLFVARSSRLCRYVAETVGESGGMTFIVFLQLIRSLEEKLPVLGDKRDVFLPAMKMDFARFKREVYLGLSDMGKSAISIDPLLVWTSIRTFLKGSVEALADNENGHCEKAVFMSFGKKRCRLSPEDRECVYKIFTRYQNFTKANRLWDDCDRIVSLLKRLGHAVQADHEVISDVHQSKIYVDEIQDYTQAEILLFFRLSGPGDLFLAGDPAQSVVEGVDFRFEEIRSVGYYVANNRRDLIPQKPKTVTTNFRSHSGVLDVAAAILRRMFDAFPDSAKQLGEDRGVFNGPRPGVFQNIAVGRLKALVSEKLRGVTVLTHDTSVAYWKRALDYELVYGVRAAKGLEFKSVIVLDFFAELPSGVQKPWRDLLLGRDIDAPELEGQLKLLYTALTRCIERLFFAETSHSLAGDAFVRWLTSTSIRPRTLATRQNTDNIEKMAMTQDEWVASGLDNAESAEMYAESNDLSKAHSMLEKAIFCFEEGKDSALARKAGTYRTSLSLRAHIQDDNEPNEALEIRAAEVLEQVGSENLLLEARRLLVAILPSIDDYVREKLEKGVLRDPILDAERMLL